MKHSIRRNESPLRLLAFAGLALLTLLPASTQAYTTRSKANNATSMSTSTSWASSTFPTATDYASFDSTITGTGTLGPAIGNLLATWYGIKVTNPGKTVTVGSGGSGSVTLTPTVSTDPGIDMSAATKAFEWDPPITLGASQIWDAGSQVMTIGVATSAKTVTVAGFTLTAKATGGGRVFIQEKITGAGATPAIICDAGTGKLQIGTANAAHDYTGGVNLNSGTLILNDASALGVGTLTINGGSMNCTAASALVWNVRNNSQIWNVDWTFIGNQALDFQNSQVTLANANRTVTVSASQLTYNGVINDGAHGYKLIKDGAGTLALGGINTFSGGFTLTAGQVNINNAQALGTVAGTFTITSGSIDCASAITTLNYPQAWNGDFTFLGSAFDLNLGSGNVTLGGNRQVTVGNSGNPTLIVGGTISGSTFSLTKLGTGTLKLTGNNTYTGGTTISAGTVRANGQDATHSGTGSGSVAVNLGTLSGNGRVAGDVTVANDPAARLYPNSGSALTVGGNLTVSGSSSKLRFDLTTTVAGANDKMVMNGSSKTLTITGNPVIDINCATIADLEAANYTLIDLGGNGVSGSFYLLPNWVGSTPGNSASFTVEMVGGNLVLKYTAPSGKTQPIRWATGSGDWDTTTPNWIDSAPTPVPQLYADGDQVQLEDTQSGASPITVTLNTPPVSPLNVLVNAAKDYTISGSGAIAGATGLTKQNSGTLTLSVANTYNGVNTLNAGTVSLGIAETVGTSGPLGGSAAVNAGNILLGGATLQYSAANQNDYSGRFSTAASQAYKVDTAGQAVTWATSPLSSSGGTLTKLGSGTLTLGAANTFNGDTRVGAGTLTLNHANALQNSTLDMNSADSGSVGFGVSGAVNVANLKGSRNLTIPSGVTLSIGANNANATYLGILGGAGGFTKTGTGTFTWGDGTVGPMSYTGDTAISQGTALILKTDFLPHGSTYGNVTVDGALTYGTAATSVGLTVNGLLGAGTITMGSASSTAPTLTIGDGDASGSFSGVIQRGAGATQNTVTKVGSGTQTLSGANSIGLSSGGFVINAGKVIAAHGDAVGAYAVTVNAGTLEIANVTLDGSLNMTLNNGATLKGSGGPASAYSRASNPSIAAGASVTLATASASDVLTLGGGIAGGGGGAVINLNGLGTIALSAAAAYTGAINVSGGTVGVGNSTCFGSTATLNINGGKLANTAGSGRTIPAGVALNVNADFTVDDSVFTTAANGQILFSGPTTLNNGNRTITVQALNGQNPNLGFSGPVGEDAPGRGLTKSGTGGTIALLNAANSYSGDTTINAGTINIDADATLGTGTGTLHLSGGKLQITANRTVTVPNPIDVTVDSVISTSSAAGTVDCDFTTSVITASAGTTLTLRNDASSGTGIWQPRLSAGGFTYAEKIAIANGSFGTTMLQSYNTSPSTQQFDGVISGTGSYKRNASVAGTGGKTIFTAANTYSGGTTVSRGTLLVNNTTGSGTGSGAVTVGSDGTLGGNGIISGTVTVQSGGILAPGTSIGTLTLGSAPSLGGTLAMEINPTDLTCDKLNLTSGTFTYGGTLALTVTAGTLSGGEAFDLFDFTGASSGSFAITTTPPLAANLNWWQGDLATTGILLLNRAPVGGSHAVTTRTNLPIAVSATKLKAGDSDPDGNPFSITAVSDPQPSGASVSLSGGVITYDPVNAAAGPGSFKYTLDDGRGGTTLVTVAVTITDSSSGGASPNLVYGPALDGSDFVARFAGIPGQSYTVESSANPTGPWVKKSNYAAPADNSLGFGIGVFEVRQATSEADAGYYRTVYPAY